MIKAVFFDWFNTLARYEPPREELQSQAFREFGINIPAKKIAPAILLADKYYFEENARLPLRNRSREEQGQVYGRYQEIILTETGTRAPEDKTVLMKIMMRMQELTREMHFTLFDDVLPTLKVLDKKFIFGVLSNLDKDMKPLCHELGLDPYIKFSVTSGEVGADKPAPPIFLEALKRAGVKASEAIHVGDQYKLDVAGARGVGIAPILIDRFNIAPDVKDCPRITTLAELPAIIAKF